MALAKSHPSIAIALVLAVAFVSANGCGPSAAVSGKSESASGEPPQPIRLLNVSYDPTRELYAEFNAAFAKFWKEKHNQDVTIEQSHAASGKQARAVIDGLDADVVSLALPFDVDQIARDAKLLPADWQQRLPHNSSPYTSTINFIVRKGNPKGLHDWDDLVKEGVEIIIPNPKISGGARYAYLAAWGYALRKHDGDPAEARKFVRSLFANAPALASGTRAATMTLTQNGIGDVLIGWENEAMLAIKDLGTKDFEIVTPPVSILAEPPVAVVDKNAAKHGTTEAAKAYLEFLYSAEGQQIVAKNFYRPSEPDLVAPELRDQFPKAELFTVGEVFGDWTKAQAEHFSDGGTFDEIYEGD